MANRLNYNDLLKYMEIVLDMEKNVYVELKSWQDLQGQINRLGIANTYREPYKHKIDGDFIGGGLAGIFLLCPFIGLILGLIIMVVIGILGNALGMNFPEWLPYAIEFCSVGLVEIIFIIMGIQERKDENNSYKYELNEYNQNIANDKARVQKELAQKQYLQAQADTLASMWRTSKEKLDKMYSYDILEEKYRNIVAVASIYEYLKYEMTRSLQRNGNDEGAYNIYERNIRLDKIITNTDIIIQKLDVVIENQRKLANTMRNAQNSINNLVTSTNNMSARLQSGMKQLNASVELSNYQQQQTNNELKYMNFMNTLHFYS